MSRKAVIVGVGQYRRNPKLDGPFVPWEPAAMMAEATRLAFDDVPVALDPADVSLLAAVDPIAWPYDDLCATVAQRCGLGAGVESMMVAPGGNSPGELLNAVANRIVDGDVEIAVLTGAECVYGRRRARTEGLTLDWTPHVRPRDLMKGQRPITNEIAARHGLTAPINCYPLFENALRAKAGRSVDEHQQFLGTFMARNAAVAATNPHAWFPVAQSAEDLATVDAGNRMVCFPYPKRMNAIMEVDLAATVIVMSTDEADRRSIPQSSRVAFLGGASAVDHWCATERVDFTSSPAIAAASSAAFAHAGVGVDDVDLFDLYSCFPSAVQLALLELGVASDDPRGVTVTGGLAYAGGPGNSYSMHGLARMTERLRAADDAATVGVVSALGMTATKHAYNVLSSSPARIDRADGRATKIGPVEPPAPTLVDHQSGPATIETYTAEYDRDGSITRTIYVLRFADGTRTIANGRRTPEELAAVPTVELVGRTGQVTAGTGSEPNLVDVALP